MVAAASDARRFERDTHRKAFRALDVVRDLLPRRHSGGEHEVVIRREKLPVEEVLQRPAVDGQELRSRGEPELGAKGVGRHRLDANHAA